MGGAEPDENMSTWASQRRMRKWRGPACGHKNAKEDKGIVSLSFYEGKRHNPRLSFRGGWVPQSREERRSTRGTHLFGFFVLSVLHRVVDMAEHILNGIRVGQIERKERHKRVVLNLSVTSWEERQRVTSFICKRYNKNRYECGPELPLSTRIDIGAN